MVKLTIKFPDNPGYKYIFPKDEAEIFIREL